MTLSINPAHPLVSVPPFVNGRRITLVETASLKPHEHHDHAHLEALCRRIKAADLWTTPIVVDDASRIILDGHHRFAVAKILDLRTVPAILTDYDDPRISVDSWRDGVTITREDILLAGRTGRLLPKKTSRHRFADVLPDCAFELFTLRHGQTCS